MSESGDYISREAFKAEIRRLSTHYLNEWDTLGVLAAADRVPAADVRPVVRGKWELDSDKLPICSNCGEIALQRIFVKVPHLIQDVRMVRSNFCPNCGADMRPEPPKEG